MNGAAASAAVRAALPPFLVSRAIVLAATLGLGPRVTQAHPGVDFWQPAEPVLRPFFHFDAQYYAVVARYGYGGGHSPPLPPPGYRVAFFPLLPLLGRLAGGSDVALLLIPNLAFLAALVLFCLLARRLLGEPEARFAPWLLSLYPGSIFLSYPYSESVLLLGCLACFWLIETRHWTWAALAGGLAAASRAPGALLLLAFAGEWLRGARGRALAAAVGPLLGLLAVGAVDLFQTGDPLGWMHGQANWVGGHRNPFFPAGEFLVALARHDPLRIEGYGFPFLAAFAAGAVWALRRLPLPQGLFAAGMVALDLWQGYYIGAFQSVPRYLVPAFPCYFAFASWLAPHPRLRLVWLMLSAAILALFATLYGSWHFVG